MPNNYDVHEDMYDNELDGDYVDDDEEMDDEDDDIPVDHQFDVEDAMEELQELEEEAVTASAASRGSREQNLSSLLESACLCWLRLR